LFARAIFTAYSSVFYAIVMQTTPVTLWREMFTRAVLGQSGARARYFFKDH
jgi:hypothetical protein